MSIQEGGQAPAAPQTTEGAPGREENKKEMEKGKGKRGRKGKGQGRKRKEKKRKEKISALILGR
jgi:hypothetical protein